MQVEALERRWTPIMAALIGAGVKGAESLVDDARAEFDRWLVDGDVKPANEVTRLDEFRKRMGVA